MIDTMHARGAIASILEEFPDADDLAVLSDAFRDLGDDLEAEKVLRSPWTVFDGVLRTRAGLAAWAESTARTLRSFPIGPESRRAYDDVIHATGFGLESHALAAARRVVEPDAFLVSLLETLDSGVFFKDPEKPQPSSDALRWLFRKADWRSVESGSYDVGFTLHFGGDVRWDVVGGVIGYIQCWTAQTDRREYHGDALSLMADLGL